MNSDELIAFNPILAKALARAEGSGEPYSYLLREIVATCVRAGVSPDKIYAVIRTGRILTEDNMKLLTRAEIKEWKDACSEYHRLVAEKPKGVRQKKVAGRAG